MYLAAVIFQTSLRNSVSLHDWHSRAILSYKISNSMDATLATEVLQDALDKYPKPKIFNSYQGSCGACETHTCIYTSKDHTDILKKT
jgi:putative transposase